MCIISVICVCRVGNKLMLNGCENKSFAQDLPVVLVRIFLSGFSKLFIPY